MIIKLIKLLTPKEYKRSLVLVSMTLVMGIMDMAGVASIAPFVAVLANSEIVETNTILNKAYLAANKYGINSSEKFLFILGILVFIFLVVSLCFKGLVTYIQVRFILMREHSIGKRLVEGYIHQPYSWFINRNSTDLGKTILSEVNLVVAGGITPMMNLISQGTISIALLVLLILIDSNLAAIVGITLTGLYFAIFQLTRNALKRSGEERYIANHKRFKAVNEAFGAFKELKISGHEQVYIDRFSDPSFSYAKHQAIASVIGQLPRFALEAIVFGGMLLIVLYLMSQGRDLSSILPVISLYAFAGYRLIPALQAVFGAITRLRHAGHSIDSLYEDLLTLEISDPHQSCETPISISQAITLSNIDYHYPSASRLVLKDLSMVIPARSKVGIVGATGSGKTTTIDIILGLLEPQKGSLKVDNQTINKHNIRGWQRIIGYVPQQIYLADDTVAANIALGVETRKIDQDAIERASKIANLHEFVINELPHQYQTKVGERGVRLSGGQRQRIGIARALYHYPQVLIMDEATSALDNLTEKIIMEAMHNLGDEITIILIAHRLSTVKACDIIYNLKNGEIDGKGTFEELLKENKGFRALNIG